MNIQRGINQLLGMGTVVTGLLQHQVQGEAEGQRQVTELERNRSQQLSSQLKESVQGIQDEKAKADLSKMQEGMQRNLNEADTRFKQSDALLGSDKSIVGQLRAKKSYQEQEQLYGQTNRGLVSTIDAMDKFRELGISQAQQKMKFDDFLEQVGLRRGKGGRFESTKQKGDK